MIKNLGAWAAGAAGVGGAVITDTYTHLAGLAAVVVCSLVAITLVAGITAVLAPGAKRRADAFKVLQAVLPMFRRSTASPSNITKKRPTKSGQCEG